MVNFSGPEDAQVQSCFCNGDNIQAVRLSRIDCPASRRWASLDHSKAWLHHGADFSCVIKNSPAHCPNFYKSTDQLCPQTRP